MRHAGLAHLGPRLDPCAEGSGVGPRTGAPTAGKSAGTTRTRRAVSRRRDRERDGGRGDRERDGFADSPSSFADSHSPEAKPTNRDKGAAPPSPYAFGTFSFALRFVELGSI